MIERSLPHAQTLPRRHAQQARCNEPARLDQRGPSDCPRSTTPHVLYPRNSKLYTSLARNLHRSCVCINCVCVLLYCVCFSFSAFQCGGQGVHSTDHGDHAPGSQPWDPAMSRGWPEDSPASSRIVVQQCPAGHSSRARAHPTSRVLAASTDH